MHKFKANDQVIVFENYGRKSFRTNVKEIGDWEIFLENGSKYSLYELKNTGKVKIFPFDDEKIKELERFYRARSIIYALQFNRSHQLKMSDELLDQLSEIISDDVVEQSIQAGISMSSFPTKDSFMYDFFNEND